MKRILKIKEIFNVFQKMDEVAEELEKQLKNIDSKYILINNNLAMTLTMSSNFSQTPMTNNNKILEFSEGLYLDYGMFAIKTFFLDQTNKLKDNEYHDFNDLLIMKNYLKDGNRLEKLERIINEE